MSSLFPVFLKLDGRRCLVVGAGTIASQKLAGLLASGARVCVVAPSASEEIRRLAQTGAIEWVSRAFEPDDLEGALLVIAATGDPDVNSRIFLEANQRGVLCNAVDEPENCDFYYPSVVRRGNLQIAISTNGHSPALAQRLRQEFETQFGSEYGEWVKWLGQIRQRLFRRSLDPEKRKSALHRLASQASFSRFSARQQRRNGVQ